MSTTPVPGIPSGTVSPDPYRSVKVFLRSRRRELFLYPHGTPPRPLPPRPPEIPSRSGVQGSVPGLLALVERGSGRVGYGSGTVTTDTHSCHYGRSPVYPTCPAGTRGVPLLFPQTPERSSSPPRGVWRVQDLGSTFLLRTPDSPPSLSVPGRLSVHLGLSGSILRATP